MNVLWRLIFASTVVLITLVATTVNAILDIIWKIMDSIVQVSASFNHLLQDFDLFNLFTRC